jgi:esterase/lipase
MTKKKDRTPSLLKFIRWSYPKVEAVFPLLAHRFFFTLFFSPLKFNAPEKELKAETFGELFTISVEGKKIQCYKWGESEKTIVLIHGWAGRATQFRRFIKPLLAAGYQVVGFDGPAHGKSEGKRTNIREFEEALKKVCERAGVPEAIIAHSFGGGVALMAAMNGLRVKTLINIASPTIGEEIIRTYLKAINGSEKTMTYFRNEVVKRYGKPFEEYTALHFVKHLDQHINMLLVHDTDDKEVSLEHPLALMEAYPAAELYQTSGLGHTRILKDDKVIRKIVSFIRQHEPARADLMPRQL